jgi:hypothetical protein
MFLDWLLLLDWLFLDWLFFGLAVFGLAAGMCGTYSMVQCVSLFVCAAAAD